MGQLKISSRVTNFVCLGLFLFNVLLFEYVNAEEEGDCEFVGVDVDKSTTPWVITGVEFSEKAVPDTTIWDVPIAKIKSSISSYHPHLKYLNGYRYTSRYEYRTSNSFREFVDDQNSQVVSRVVTFTCENDGQVTIRFNFPLIDENDPPKFVQSPKELSVKNGSDEVINAGKPIIVQDTDWNSDYNIVSTASSDRPDILITSISTREDLPNGMGKQYFIELKLNNSSPIREGLYSLNLFATDGKFTASQSIKIHVTPATTNP